jgi:hypothetical protein
MWARKCTERSPFKAELDNAGIAYMPVVFTSYGRPHADASRVLHVISKQVARRKGWSATAGERHMRARIGAALAQPSVRMSLATWPSAHDAGDVELPEAMTVAPGAEFAEAGGTE